MKVLLAVDGSETSELAVNEVATRPWREGTEVKILAVAASRYPDWFVDPALVIIASHVEEVREHHKRLTNLVGELEDRIRNTENGKKLSIESQVVDGYPKEEIVDEAKRWGADLIVMGSHGYGNFKRFLLGSVAQAVVAHAPCSVQIFRKKEE